VVAAELDGVVVAGAVCVVVVVVVVVAVASVVCVALDVRGVTAAARATGAVDAARLDDERRAL